MRRSHFASFLGALFSLIVGLLVAPVIELGRAFIRFDHSDHRASLDRDVVAHNIDAVPITARFMVFVKRCLDRDLFSAGRFIEGRSPAT